MLDCNSFHAARNVCKWWRFASFNPGTLWKQLRELPVQPAIERVDGGPLLLASLFDETAYKLMMGMRVNVKQDKPVGYLSACKTSIRPRMTATSCGSRLVTLNDRSIALFDMSGPQPRILAQRRLNDSRAVSGGHLWLKNVAFPSAELGLSSDDGLLAVAQGRSILIYDLSNGSDCVVGMQNIPNVTEHHVIGLQFNDDGYALRVHRSRKGTVIYLGTPLTKGMRKQKAGMKHWASECGLTHAFLDSSHLTLGSAALSEDYSARFSGLQLLRPFSDGYIFASQKHGGGESSHYILGHEKRSKLSNGGGPVLGPSSVTELAKLETFLSSRHYNLSGLAESVLGTWDKMPSAHEDIPSFALSPDGTMLALAERHKRRVGFYSADTALSLPLAER